MHENSFTALVDSGSMVTTLSLSGYHSMKNQPELKDLSNLGLEISVADGSLLKYKGYIECSVKTPFSNVELFVPVLIVPDTDFNRNCPVIIGTNVLRICRDQSNQDSLVPKQWKLAFDSMTSKCYSVKSIGKKPMMVKPNESMVIKGCVKGLPKSNNLTMVSENCDHVDKFTVCPRVVEFTKPGSKSMVHVNICNISAKPLLVRRGTVLCNLQEIKVVDNIVTLNPPTKTCDPIELGVKVDSNMLTNNQYETVKHLLREYSHVFSTGPLDLGRTNLVQHTIELEDTKPFKQPYRRIPPGMYEEVRQHIREMLDAGVIRESNSNYSSNVVLCRKSDGSLRFCLDMRMLNSKTRKDCYMLPRFDDVIDTLYGAKFFSKLDLRSGYWQVEIEEKDRHKTAFSVGNLGFYECNRMSFGLTNAPATFQRLMEKCMGDMHLKECLIFLDDLLIFSNSFQEHCTRLENVFRKLAEHDLKLKPSKCELFKTSVIYLGHIISEKGIQTDPEKLSAVRDWPTPTNIKELRQFLGFVGYYRRFIQNFANIVAPLNALLQGHGTVKKHRRKKKGNLPVKWQWTERQEEAFQAVKSKLLEPPVLGFANYKLPFILHTDASSVGLGAVLYQVQDGKKRVIAYASRGLRASERNYPAHKLEFLALKWAVSDKFHDYLYGTSFQVITDNNPLTYVLHKAKLDATSQRWVAALASYNFTIKYRPGQQNADADGLSRQLFADAIKAICQSVTCTVPYCQSIGAYSEAHRTDEEEDEAQHISEIDWRQEQRNDQVLSRVIELKEQGFYPNRFQMKREVYAVQRFFREWRKLYLRDGILLRKAKIDDREVHQLVIPEVYREVAFQGIHRDTGHPGKDKTLWLARQRFFWPGLEKEISQKVENCPRCIRRKTPSKPFAQLVPIETTHPMELVCIDFLSLEKSKGGIENILVITDHFTRFAQAIPCRSQKANVTAKALYENFFLHYGFPEKLHSDQGRNFESKVVRELCKLLGIKKTRTTPYHPMGNGSVERFNQTLLKMLGTLEHDQKADWKSHVAPLVQAYNATKSDATGFSPHMLMFGWNPKLPIDSFLGLDLGNEGDANPRGYVEKLQQRMQSAYAIAAEEARKTGLKNKERYNIKVRETKLEQGDKVLVRNVGLKGKNKLADRWEDKVYVVQEMPDPRIPVYRVRAGDKSGRTRTLHRNMLLPCTGLDKGEEIQKAEYRVKKVYSVKKVEGNSVQEAMSSGESETESDSENYSVQRVKVTSEAKRDNPPEMSSIPPISSVMDDDSSIISDNSLNNCQYSISFQNSSEELEDSNIQSTPDQSLMEAAPTIRRSTRVRKAPDRYGEWI